MPDELTNLAKKYLTDKWDGHFYTPHYERFFNHLKNEPVKLLEIGVGGYGDPNSGGESLRMWKEYFPQGAIFAIDVYNKESIEEDRIKIYQGSQVDKFFLETVTREAGEFDIIIDDGSHINRHIIESFKLLFPTLKQHGIYVVEDLQTSYWPKFGGDSFNLRNKSTAMNYFKHLTDSLNYEEIDNPSYRANYFDRNIISISFFHNIIFIQKGPNNEGSNIIKNNAKPTRHPVKANLGYALRSITRYFSRG